MVRIDDYIIWRRMPSLLHVQSDSRIHSKHGVSY